MSRHRPGPDSEHSIRPVRGLCLAERQDVRRSRRSSLKRRGKGFGKHADPSHGAQRAASSLVVRAVASGATAPVAAERVNPSSGRKPDWRGSTAAIRCGQARRSVARPNRIRDVSREGVRPQPHQAPMQERDSRWGRAEPSPAQSCTRRRASQLPGRRRCGADLRGSVRALRLCLGDIGQSLPGGRQRTRSPWGGPVAISQGAL